jgi:hypothetical protein
MLWCHDMTVTMLSRVDVIEKIKWAGTILCLIGIALTSYDVYPFNLVLGFIGSSLWTYAGVLQKDRPLMLVEGVAVLIYLSGLFHWMVR